MIRPSVSVIIPTFNRANYIGEAIQSVLDQTFKEFEIIIVDDGSTDSTQQVVGSFHDARIRYLREPHRGIGASMNRGIASSTGAYVARLDSDDVWLPHLLAVEMAVLAGHPEVGAAYARAEAMNERRQPLPTGRGMPPRYPGDSFLSLLYEDSTSTITTIVRRACFEKAGLYDESLTTSEDWDMALRIGRYYPLLFVDQVLGRFRLHETNLTGPDSFHFAESLENRRRVLDKIFAEPNLPSAAIALRPVAYRNVYTTAGLQWLHKRHFRDAVSLFALAFRAGGNPIVTATRIVWFVLNWELFSRYGWSRRFATEVANLRRRWRDRGPGRAVGPAA
jgi:glycosyltransferase involved in cell wall biosynthesis